MLWLQGQKTTKTRQRSWLLKIVLRNYLFFKRVINNLTKPLMIQRHFEKKNVYIAFLII